ncbi:hypothetical protein LCGC14_0626090 [marine sediment metagenome]|uniref:Fungal lipase-type domain-containing protein n=1 Tax=marine sediment metagenome TaxID=412755 RepID=A0A0F9R8E3_9ZZZZ
MITDLDLAIFMGRAYDDPPTFSSNGTQCSLYKIDDATVYAVRGTTKNYADIKTDLRGLPSFDIDLGWGHSGFQSAALAIWPLIEASVYEQFVSHRRVIYVGHSLGGAVATNLARLTLKRRLGTPLALITCGSPRVGLGSDLNESLASIPHRRRYVNGDDAVTTHPWSVWGFRHVDELERLGTRHWHLGWWGVGRWHNHRMQEYIDRIQRYPRRILR